MMLNVASGWHAHLDIFVERIGGTQPAPFWDHWAAEGGLYEAAGRQCAACGGATGHRAVGEG